MGYSASCRIKPNRNFVNGNSMHPMGAGSQQKPQREKRTETIVINNPQAKQFCKKAGYMPCHTENKHLQLSSNRTTLPRELCIPFFPEIKRRERRKKQQKKECMCCSYHEKFPFTNRKIGQILFLSHLFELLIIFHFGI